MLHTSSADHGSDFLNGSYGDDNRESQISFAEVFFLPRRNIFRRDSICNSVGFSFGKGFLRIHLGRDSSKAKYLADGSGLYSNSKFKND